MVIILRKNPKLQLEKKEDGQLFRHAMEIKVTKQNINVHENKRVLHKNATTEHGAF